MAAVAVTHRGIGPAAGLAGHGGWVTYLPVLSLLALVASCVWLAVWSVRRLGGGADDSDEGETGGGGWGRGPRPISPPPDADPEWWPEFERQFAAYVGDLRPSAGSGKTQQAAWFLRIRA